MHELIALSDKPKKVLEGVIARYIGDSNMSRLKELIGRNYEYHSLFRAAEPIPVAMRDECRFTLNLNSNYSNFIFVPADFNGFPSQNAYLVMGRR